MFWVWACLVVEKIWEKKINLEFHFQFLSAGKPRNGNKLVAEKIWEKKEINLGFYALLGWWEKGKERKEIYVLEY